MGKNLLEPKNKNNESDKEFVIRLPFINEAFSRVAKSKIKEAGISARVVICPGIKLKSQVTNKKSFCSTNNCTACNMNIPCDIRNFVYKATCLKCKDEYLGCSARPASERLKEYESSIRLRHQNERTSLGRHKAEKHNGEVDDVNENFKFEVVAKAKDPLGVCLTEGLLIKQQRPQTNNQLNNGFVI